MAVRSISKTLCSDCDLGKKDGGAIVEGSPTEVWRRDEQS